MAESKIIGGNKATRKISLNPACAELSTSLEYSVSTTCKNPPAITPMNVVKVVGRSQDK